MPLHWSFPPQSPVWHEPEPVTSNVQPVLAHIRPDHPGGVGIVMLWPESNWNPVAGSGGVPAPDSVPGHIVKGQLLVMMNVHANELVKKGKNVKEMRNVQEAMSREEVGRGGLHICSFR